MLSGMASKCALKSLLISTYPIPIEQNRINTNAGVVSINRLIRDLTILISNFDDQSQFWKTNYFSDYLHIIKRRTFCFSYL